MAFLVSRPVWWSAVGVAVAAGAVDRPVGAALLAGDALVLERDFADPVRADGAQGRDVPLHLDVEGAIRVVLLLMVGAEHEDLLERDSLIASSHTTARVVVETPTRFASASLSVQVTEALDPEWDPVDAHEQVGDLVVRIGFGSSGSAIRDELIRTCVPFLQPDSSMRESIIRDELIVQILVTRASLMQLLATERPLLPVEDRKPPPPTTLHYTAKWSLTEAFVTGRAVRAVCGQWWVPVGDESTHAALPLCPECEQETPFAQTARDLILRLGKD